MKSLSNKGNTASLGKIYFVYLFLAMFLQIVGLNSKGSMLDTFWKAGVIAATMLFVFFRSGCKIRLYIVFPSFIYVIGQIIAIWLCPRDVVAGTNISGIINIVVIVAMTYLFLSAPYEVSKFDIGDVTFFLDSLILLSLYAVIYNAITNPDSIVNFMSNKNVYQNMMYSFFDNKQTFGMFLFIAFIASVLQYVIKGQSRYLFAMLIFFLNLFICLSRTALFACLAFLILVPLLMFRVKPKLSYTLFSSIAIAVLVVLMVPDLREFLFDVVLDTDDTMETRGEIWSDALSALHGKFLIFGYGEGNVANLLRSENAASKYSHNGIVQVLLTGGIVKICLYMLVLIKGVSASINVAKHNKSLGLAFICAIATIFVYSMGESIVFLDSSVPCIVASIMCLAMPCGMERYYMPDKGIKKGANA